MNLLGLSSLYIYYVQYTYIIYYIENIVCSVCIPNIYYCSTVYSVYYIYTPLWRSRLFCAAKQSIMMKDIRIILILSRHTRKNI